MADAILMAGGTGGVTSDDVTASKAHVLQGYRTVTADSDDEVVEGEMINRGNGMDTVELVDAHWENKYAFRMEQGYYVQVDQWKPYVSVPYAVLANGIHLDANKMLDNLTVLGVRGTIPIRGYHGPDSAEMWLYPAEGGYVVRLEEGYYHKSDEYKPYVIAPTTLVKSAVNYHPEKTLSDTTTCGEQGQVKMINTQDNNYRHNKSTTFGIDNWSDLTNPVFYIDFPHGNGYYHRADNFPHVCINADVLGDATADKVVVGSTFTSKNGVAVQGQIVDRGDGAVVSYLQGREDWANRIWVLFKNGWYHREPYNDGQGHIHEAFVYVTYEQLKNLFGIDANQMLQGYGIAGVQGAISKWICTTGDVITALNGEGFVWDDTHASRGRGIVVKIPNGHFIQGANWVFLPSPNLYPQNIVKGVSINGVTGTRDWADRTNEYAINSNVSVSQLQNNQPIALGNAFSGSETLFIGVDLVGVDVDSEFVRRDKGNGRRNIGRILLGKNDSNFVASFIRRCPVQVEISRDWAGNMSFIPHIANGWNFEQTQFYVYIYGHSSMQNNF